MWSLEIRLDRPHPREKCRVGKRSTVLGRSFVARCPSRSVLWVVRLLGASPTFLLCGDVELTETARKRGNRLNTAGRSSPRQLRVVEEGLFDMACPVLQRRMAAVQYKAARVDVVPLCFSAVWMFQQRSRGIMRDTFVEIVVI